MKKVFALVSALAACAGFTALACTSLIATRGAHANGSNVITYNADSHVLYGAMNHSDAAQHAPGDMRTIVDWDTQKVLGQIPQAQQTYTVNGNVNSEGLAVTESTWGGRHELAGPNGIIDYGSLIYLALERCKTAREAVDFMTSIVQEYGYASEGESFSIADPNEVWILEMIGKGADEKGTVWVARRVPDGYISGHANQSRIHQFPFNDPNTLYSADVIDFARKKGYYQGPDSLFSFSKAYANGGFVEARGCDARVWAFFNKHAAPGEMDPYLPYVMTGNGPMLPLWIKPAQPLTTADMRAMMGDHFEGTPMSMLQADDPGKGGFDSPYRWRPMDFTVDSVKYTQERAISTQQTGFSVVADLNPNRPAGFKALMWWTADDPAVAAYIPIFGNVGAVPHQIAEGNGDLLNLSWDAMFWANNYVANQAYNRYSQMMPIIAKVKQAIEGGGEDWAQRVSDTASPQAAQKLANAFAEKTTKTYKELGDWLLVKFLDGNVKKTNDDGTFVRTPEGLSVAPEWPGYSQDFYEEIAKSPAGKRLAFPADSE